MKKAASVLLLLLFLAGTTPFAAAYTDLPSGHWAYADMSRAVERKPVSYTHLTLPTIA